MLNDWKVAKAYAGFYKFENVKYKRVFLRFFAISRQSACVKLQQFLSK